MTWYNYISWSFGKRSYIGCLLIQQVIPATPSLKLFLSFTHYEVIMSSKSSFCLCCLSQFCSRLVFKYEDPVILFLRSSDHSRRFHFSLDSSSTTTTRAHGGSYTLIMGQHLMWMLMLIESNCQHLPLLLSH